MKSQTLLFDKKDVVYFRRKLCLDMRNSFNKKKKSRKKTGKVYNLYLYDIKEMVLSEYVQTTGSHRIDFAFRQNLLYGNESVSVEELLISHWLALFDQTAE